MRSEFLKWVRKDPTAMKVGVTEMVRFKEINS